MVKITKNKLQIKPSDIKGNKFIFIDGTFQSIENFENNIFQ